MGTAPVSSCGLFGSEGLGSVGMYVLLAGAEEAEGDSTCTSGAESACIVFSDLFPKNFCGKVFLGEFAPASVFVVIGSVIVMLEGRLCRNCFGNESFGKQQSRSLAS